MNSNDMPAPQSLPPKLRRKLEILRKLLPYSYSIMAIWDPWFCAEKYKSIRYIVPRVELYTSVVATK